VCWLDELLDGGAWAALSAVVHATTLAVVIALFGHLRVTSDLTHQLILCAIESYVLPRARLNLHTLRHVLMSDSFI
jgi:hypothetical protein